MRHPECNVCIYVCVMQCMYLCIYKVVIPVILAWFGILSGFTIIGKIAKIVIYTQVRVNGVGNYNYLGQRWDLKLVVYIM